MAGREEEGVGLAIVALWVVVNLDGCLMQLRRCDFGNGVEK